MMLRRRSTERSRPACGSEPASDSSDGEGAGGHRRAERARLRPQQPRGRHLRECSTDPGQISKLLRRLERLGLLVNTGAGHAKGEPNAWALTDKGQQVTHSIRMHARDRREAA